MTRAAALLLPALLLAAGACRRASPQADAALAENLPWLYANFDGDAEEVAEVLRSIEARTYETLDLTGGVVPRSLEQHLLVDADLEGITHPGRDLATALPMSVAFLSAHEGDAHADVVMMESQTEVEPYSPDKYDRTFLEGGDCWRTRDCETLRTLNDLVKKNALMEVPYLMHKDFRWIDLSEDDTPRWAVIAKTWIEEPSSGDSGKSTIQQAYTIEYTLPRDGRGFLAADAEGEVEIAEDSDASGTLRLQALWSETTFDGLNIGEDMVKGTMRAGIDRNYEAADRFLD